MNIPLEKISEVLGHKNINTIFDIYCGIIDAQDQIKATISHTMDPAIALTNSGGGE